MYGGTKQGLSLDDVKNYIVILPTIEEQHALVDWIENNTVVLNAASEHTRGEIKFLREYHTRLIADVVTGKLDVREAAANLPEEPEAGAPEPLEETEMESGEDEDIADEDREAVPGEVE